jgi:hypothetical protein
MKDELEAKLQEAFPSMFKNLYGKPQQTCMAFGIECGDGWFDLLYELCHHIEERLRLAGNPEFTFDQIKEKFGLIRIYYSGYHADEISTLIDWAEKVSAKTCEQCGKPGKATSKGWIKVRCLECR